MSKTKTSKSTSKDPEQGSKLVAFRLPKETRDQLTQLADLLQGGNQTAALREIIRKAHRQEFGR